MAYYNTVYNPTSAQVTSYIDTYLISNNDYILTAGSSYDFKITNQPTLSQNDTVVEYKTPYPVAGGGIYIINSNKLYIDRRFLNIFDTKKLKIIIIKNLVFNVTNDSNVHIWAIFNINYIATTTL
jgi:hypothetical protein